MNTGRWRNDVGRRLADLETVLGTHRREVQVRRSQSHLGDPFYPGGRTDLRAGGRIDEARKGERLCFHDREAGKARGARQVEATKNIFSDISAFVCVELELQELAIISSNLASGVLES